MNNAMKVLITDAVDPQCIEILKQEGLEVDYAVGGTPDQIRERISSADALIVRSSTQVTAELLEAGKLLKVVGRAGGGGDNIDGDTATRRGIVVMNTPGGNTVSTAEHTISMMLALARNIPQASQSVKEGKWDRKTYVGTEVQGKTLGVIGLGKVGAEVARRAACLGMKVLAFDPAQSKEFATKIGAELVGFTDVLKGSDFVSVHSPLLPETKGLIGEHALQQCKLGVRIINCARGGIVDEQALLKALEAGKVAGAALDVFEKEPPVDSPLVSHPKVIVTPHLGASTDEAQEEVAIQIAHQVADALHGRDISGSVNADIVRIAMQTGASSYLYLAGKLGQLLSQLKEGNLRSIVISVYGKVLRDALPAVSAAVLKGVFEKVLVEPVNLLNAPMIARERGISVQLRQSDEHGLYMHVLSVEYQTEKEQRQFSGTVFGADDARIVGIDEFHFEIKPEGNLLLYHNIDRPGMLASVSSILAKSNINIGGLSLGRLGPGKKALTVVSVDTKIPHPVPAQISRLDGVSDVKNANL